jgi:hypothetical protein
MKPKALDVGSITLYLDTDELAFLIQAMAFGRVVLTSGIGYKQVATYMDLEDRLMDKLKEYERRMKDAN